MQTLFEQAEAAFGAPVTTAVNNALVDFVFNGDARPRAEMIGYDAFERAGSGRVINNGTNLVQNPVVPYHDYTASRRRCCR